MRTSEYKEWYKYTPVLEEVLSLLLTLGAYWHGQSFINI